MATQYAELFAALAAPFDSNEVKVKSLSGRQMHYITARNVMNRLDEVLGPENWTDDYTSGENSVLCRLTIRLPDGSTLTKADAGGYAGMSDEGDDAKSGHSDAFKRAAVKFGVARYLYRDGVPNYQAAPASAPAPVQIQPGPTDPPIGGNGKTPRDDRSCWQLISDEVMRINSAFQADHPDAEEITTAPRAVGRLLHLAWQAGHVAGPPSPKTAQGELVASLTGLYADQRQWVRSELKKYLGEMLAEATRKAEGATA